MFVVRLALLFLISSFCYAETAKPNDFAYGFEVNIGQQEGLYALELPEQVYQHVVDARLGDVRLFDGNKIIPIEFSRVKEQSQSIEKKYQMPFFPFKQHALQSEQRVSVEFGLEQQLKQLVVEPSANEGNILYEGIIIDNREHGYSANGLEVTFKPDVAEQWLDIDVYTSDDLKSWRRVGSATLSKLEFTQQVLEQTKVSLPKLSSKFVKIDFNQLVSDIAFDTIYLTESKFVVDKPSQLQQAVFALQAGDEKNQYVISIPSQYPVSFFELSNLEKNKLYKARLYTRYSDEADWQIFTSFTQFDILTDTKRLKSDKLRFFSSARQWMIEFDEPVDLDEYTLPTLEISWQAQEISFLKQSDGPYLLAFGAENINRHAYQLSDDIKSEIGEVHQANLGQFIELGGETKKGDPEKAKQQAYFKTGLFWLAIMFAVGLLMWMAIRLLKQTKSEES